MTWIGVNTSLKFHLRQLGRWVFFGAVWPLHLGTLGGGVACGALVRPRLGCAAPVWHPCHETQIGQVERVRGTAAGWTCGGWRNAGGVGGALEDLAWPSLGPRREQSSLAFFCKIHSGAVDLDKYKYLTPAPNLRRTRASHESQYTRCFAYSDALKNSFFHRTVPMWSGLPSSVVSSGTIWGFEAQVWIVGTEVCVLACLCTASCRWFWWPILNVFPFS